MSTARKVLIIAYQFCPKGQIGTRRWSKFAKYFSRAGLEVHVLCAKYKYRDNVNWCHEVEGDPNIIIHRIPSASPNYVMQPTRTFGVKLLDRLLKRTFYWHDYSQYWGRHLIKAAPNFIQQHDIKDVFVTGGPFGYFPSLVQLKERCPNIQLTIDYRDPWVFWRPQRNALQRKRYQRVEAAERSLAEAVDYIVYTTADLQKRYLQLVPEQEAKMKVIYNGFDEDDFMLGEVQQREGFKMVYTGSLTRERADAVLTLVKAVQLLKNSQLETDLQIHIYGVAFAKPVIEDSTLSQLWDKMVKHMGSVPQADVFKVIKSYPISLSITAPEHAELIGAKTFDYMGLQKPIFLLSPPCTLADILTENGQYWADYKTAHIQETLLKIYDNYKSNASDDQHVDYQQFNYHHLTKQFLELMTSE